MLPGAGVRLVGFEVSFVGLVEELHYSLAKSGLGWGAIVVGVHSSVTEDFQFLFGETPAAGLGLLFDFS